MEHSKMPPLVLQLKKLSHEWFMRVFGLMVLIGYLGTVADLVRRKEWTGFLGWLLLLIAMCIAFSYRRKLKLR
jgi:hypothetical protein